MFEYRHTAYNITTGEFINSPHGNHLKREVARTEKFNREYYGVHSQWRWSHDFGKKWDTNGLPQT